MEDRAIICPHCKKKVDIELAIQNVQKLELGIGIKVRKVQAETQAEKEKPKTKEN